MKARTFLFPVKKLPHLIFKIGNSIKCLSHLDKIRGYWGKKYESFRNFTFLPKTWNYIPLYEGG